MERNLYFENYINNLQKNVFLLAYDSNYEIISFISFYMKSYVRREMDKPYTQWHSQPPQRIMEEVLSYCPKIEIVPNQNINRNAVEWLGFFYSKWHFLTLDSSKSIVRFLPPKDGLKNYYVLHQLDEKRAIEICKRRYNISRNNHRNYENKNSQETSTIYDDSTYYSFLSSRILYKLTKNQLFNDLLFVGDKNNYDFADSAYSIGIKNSVIFDKNDSSIIEEYKEKDNLAYRFKRKAYLGLYFCFIFSSKYINDSEQLQKDIKEIKTKYPPNIRRYDYLYFYIQGKLYEITSSNELYVYSIPISSRDRAGIINKMKEYGL